MSWQALAWAGRQTVGHAHSKAVLMHLANYADEQGECFPSHDKLAALAEVSTRTVQDCIKRLAAGGYVTTRRQRNREGKLGLTRYRLALDRSEQPPEAASGGGGAPDPAKPAAGRGLPGDQPPEALSGGPPEAPPEAATGSSFRSDTPGNPPDESVEREGAREEPKRIPRADRPEFRKAVAELKRLHPAGGYVDALRLEQAALNLSEAQLRKAIELLPAWEANKPPSRKVLPSLEQYLQGRLWESVPQAVVQARSETAFVAPYSRAWWWLWIEEVRRLAPVLTDDAARRQSRAAFDLGQRVSGATNNIGWRVPGEDLDAIEERARALVQVAVGTPEHGAWRDHWRGEGAHGTIWPEPDRAPFVFMPATSPEASTE